MLGYVLPIVEVCSCDVIGYPLAAIGYPIRIESYC